MGFLRRILGGGAGGSGTDRGLYLYVRCNACGEPIQVRVDPANDLSPVYDDESDEEAAYELRKQILGNRCFRLIEGYWRFDRNKRLIGGEIEGGTEITEAEYEAETSGV
jgi:hypothetical protein